MKVLLFRSNNIFASRVNKYINFYKNNDIDYTAVGWNRFGEAKKIEHYDFCNYKAGTNVGGIKAMINHSKWMYFVFKYLKTHQEVTTIHACDLNTAFPAAIYKKFINNNVTLIFDVCDWFSANFAKYTFLCKILLKMEKFACHKANHIIICEPERIAQIPFKLDKEPYVMPNIPDISDDIEDFDKTKYGFQNDLVTIGYFGGFSNGRFLLELLELTKTQKFNLLIAGYGSKEIEDKCLEVSKLENVKYFGRMDMKEGLQMSSCADLIYTMYCKTNPNHIFAAPNKFYEALFLGKPQLTTKGIIVEDKVLKYDIGFSTDESVDEMLLKIESMDRTSLRIKGDNARKLWDEKYKNYISNFFLNEYSNVIK